VSIKNRLKEIRMREYQMNVSEFAKYLDTKLSTYSKWENGDSTPTLQKAYDIAKILKKDLIEIWYED
jgi:DNA-binding XRE family transcriptional regulator